MDWTISKLLLLLIILWAEVAGQDVNVPNEVIGEPIVSCAADAIYVKLRTKSTFLGHVDVKYTADKTCFQSLVTNNQIEVLIPHEECMVPRRRSQHAIGVILEASLSVSFHPEFTTVDDRVFNLQCFHQKKSNASLQIGSPTPPPAPPSTGPTCSYMVRSYAGGPPVGRLALGQSVYHSWQCENIGESCVIVENCELVAGEQRHMVIDADGCSKHESIMPQLEYHNTSHAGAVVKVFGVSNTPIVYFACQIRLEARKPSGDCPVPQCDSNNQHRFRREIQQSIDVRSQNLEISQLVNISAVPTMENVSCEISNQSDNLLHESQPHSDPSQQDDDQICAAFRSVLITVIALIVASILVTTIVVFLVVRRQKYEIASMS